jgi:hypothetical protein
MKFVTILVEGQTEETFVRDVLNPAYPSLHLTPVLYETGRRKSGHKQGGGGVRYASVKHQLRQLLNDTSAALVTTLLDYHRLDSNFPGQNHPPTDVLKQVENIERALEDELDAGTRFKAYLSIHDFEALVFTDVTHIAQIVPNVPSNALSTLQTILFAYSTPEHINQGEPPGHRLEQQLPAYRKAAHSPLIVESIGLKAIRRTCAHFDQWLRALEQL